MKEPAKDKRLLILPVRRALMAATLSYLAGVLLASLTVFPTKYIGFLSMLFIVPGVRRLRQRKSVLFPVMAIMLLLGVALAGREICTRDMPTAPGVQLEGTVCRIEKPYRVYLTDVSVDGKPADYARDVVVTLMLEEEAGEPPQPLVGQRVSGKGRLFAPEEKRNPGGMDRRIQSIVKGYELSGYLLPGWMVWGEGVYSLRESMRMLRLAVDERITRLFGEHAPLFRGIMLGDRSALDDEVTAAMRMTGIAHILTVSGLHLSLIAGVVSGLLGRMALRRKIRFLILGAFLLLFTGLTGAAAGTVRACIMALLRERAKLRGRRYEPLTALSFAALCMTLAQPLWLLSASFQFSFFASLSIQLFAGGISSLASGRLNLSGRLQRLSNLLAVSLSAQLGAVPMQLMLYGYVPLLSLPMNVLCAMLMPLLLLGGWICAAVSVFCVSAGACMAKPLVLAAAALETVSLSVAALDGALLRLPAPYGMTVLLVFVLFLLMTSRIRLGPRRYPAALLVLCAAVISYALRFDPMVRYVQLDVGQGDGALLRRGRHAVLIDVGPADSYDALHYLRREGLFVDAAILSHLDEDHAGALGVLLGSEIEVPHVITATGAAQQALSQEVHEALGLLAQRGTALHEVRRGDRIDVSGFSFDVLSPDDTLQGSNERSLLLHAQAEGVSFLLAGDLPIACEPEYVPDVDVLKVAHHGSKNATSDAFVQMAQPELAIISVGENNWYGHPQARVLDALEDAQVMRTDRHGCITLRLKNGAYEAECYLDADRSFIRKIGRIERIFK